MPKFTPTVAYTVSLWFLYSVVGTGVDSGVGVEASKLLLALSQVCTCLGVALCLILMVASHTCLMVATVHPEGFSIDDKHIGVS